MLDTRQQEVAKLLLERFPLYRMTKADAADYPLSLHQHLTLLIEAGFVGADVLYKRDILAMYLGMKK